jgi:hypothetical protein
MHIVSRAVPSEEITCDWQALQEQLLSQWNRLTASELIGIMYNRRRIALLVERKYGIPYRLVENYLRNFEQTMPLAA